MSPTLPREPALAGAAALGLILARVFPPLSAVEIRLLFYLARLSADGQFAIDGVTEAQLVEGLGCSDAGDGRGGPGEGAGSRSPEGAPRGSGPSDRTVRRALYRLAERGLVRVQPQYARSGAQMPNRYSLNLDWRPPPDEG